MLGSFLPMPDLNHIFSKSHKFSLILACLKPIFGLQTRAFVLNTGRIEAVSERYTDLLNSPWPVVRSVSGCSLSQDGYVGPCYNRKVIAAWEGSSLNSCHRLFIHQSCPSWIPRWLQRTAQGKDRYKMETGMLSFYPAFFNICKPRLDPQHKKGKHPQQTHFFFFFFLVPGI
jgi:hypothetical protein